MGKNTIFTGAAAAIITPFRDNCVDYDALGGIIDFQIENGTDAIVVCGTTGEASTLTDDEHRAVIKYTIERTAHRVPVIAGTGSNDTDYAIDLSREACELGADALLLVTPYYNKATPRGLIKSFAAVADAVDCPSILYNVPSRTGCSITMPVYRELADHPRIVAVKEASGNFSLIASLIAECGDKLDVYSGNDDQIVPIMSLGGKGVISVLSNIMPAQTHAMAKACLDGDFKAGAKLQLDLLGIIDALFCEVNPIPVKTAMAAMNFCTEELRLPLCEMESPNKAALLAAMREYRLIG